MHPAMLPSSVDAPVDGVPVANQGQNKQQHGNQQQPGGFRRIDVVPRMLCRRDIGFWRVWHMDIVDPWRKRLGSVMSVLHYRFTVCEKQVLALSFSTNRSSRMAVPPAHDAGKLVRFGVFEMDLAAGELRKSGSKIRLQEQPFQLLAYLVHRPGEVVTREDLREKLWPSDTFVDFDHSLNTAVNKVRDALGDSASSPRFVETLARRGYRFIAPVEHVESHSAAAALGPLRPAASWSTPESSLDPELEVPVPHRGLIRTLFALIQVMYLVFYVIALFHLQEVHRIADSFLPGWSAFVIQVAVLITAAVGIPLRLYLLSAVGFDYRGLAPRFRRLFPFILALDQLWAIAPFLLAEQIGVGPALAATAALLYVPFSERTLIRMAYGPLFGEKKTA